MKFHLVYSLRRAVRSRRSCSKSGAISLPTFPLSSWTHREVTMLASKPPSVFTNAARLIVSVAVLFIGQNSSWAQVATEPVKPYVFDKDLRTLPPPPPETRKAHRPGTKPDFEAKPFRPGPPDPLWHPGRKPGTRGGLIPG